MSGWTQLNRLFFILSGVLAVLAPFATHAGPVSDAQEQLNKAYNDYYDAVSQGGKKSPEEDKKLREKLIDPAMQGLNQAVKEEAEQAVKEHERLSPRGGGVAGSSAPTSEAPKAAPVTETPLDSTDIPRELEFPGKPVQPKNAPTVLPSSIVKPNTQPYLGPYAPKSQ